MRFTFILACHNVLTRIDDCLAALRQCARPGDSLVIVDDGSTDGTDAYLDRLARTGAIGLPCRIDLLGAHGASGLSIPFRIGLETALKMPDSDAIVLVNGGDMPDPAGLSAAQAHFGHYKPDMLCANYAVQKPPGREILNPPDMPAWGRIHAAPHASLHERRAQALALHPAPWRAIYGSAFLREAGLGFPVGVAGQETALFHWETCLAARSFAFLDRRICIHRAGPAAEGCSDAPGDHFAAFARICDLLAAGHSSAWAHPLATDAVVWLLTRMGPELEQLEFARCRGHAEQACAALGTIPGEIWASACRKLGAGHPILPVGEMLRTSAAADVAAHWEIGISRRETLAVLTGLRDLGEQIADQSRTSGRLLQTLYEIERFSALSEMCKRRLDPTFPALP